MRSRKILRGALLTFLLAGLTLAAFAPMAAAQSPSDATATRTDISATPPANPIKPLGTPAVIPLTITYTYQPQSNALLATEIDLQVTQAPSWAIVTLSPSTVYASVDSSSVGGQRQTTVHASLIVQTTADAPAFQQGNIQIQATAQQNQGLGPSSGSTQVPVTADYFSILDASVPNSVVIAKPQQTLNFPVSITNLGNADTTVFVTADPGSTGLQISTPPQKTVPSKQQGAKDNTIDIPVSVQTPYHNGYINTPAVLNLHITSTYAYDVKQKGMQSQVSLLITTKGFYVPGPGAGSLVASLAALALVLRRRSLLG